MVLINTTEIGDFVLYYNNFNLLTTTELSLFTNQNDNVTKIKNKRL